ncbi:MAG: DUF2298 domain-containing protein [Acidobacteriota bacterium]
MMLLQALAWYGAVALGGAAVLGALRRCGLGTGVASAVARVVAWVVAGYLGWLAGWLGLAWWWWVGFVALAALAFWGRRSWREVGWKALIEPELVGAAAFLLLALLRLSAMDVRGTEKPMDLAILATLLRPGSIPPGDPWLSGLSLPYYYWGFVPWLLPAKCLGLAPDVTFNLLVPTLAAVTAQAAWALARALGGSRRTGIMAGFLTVFAGTPEGWRQLIAGTPLGSSDMWHASRQITGTITEFPLFTFHLGDLHPHLLCVPFLLVALFLARGLGAGRRGTGVPFPLVALVFGAAAAANPWCALPLGVAILLIAVAREERFLWPVGDGRALWLRVVGIGIFGWLLYAPFWMHYRPPFNGMGLVHTPTRPDQFFLLLGGALLAPVLVAWQVSARFGGFDPQRRRFIRAAWIAAVVVIAGLGLGVALGLVLAVGGVLAIAVLRGRYRRARPAWALALVALGLLAAMESVFLRDPYGEELYRMNTVFKATHLAFTLLGVLTPVMLGWLRRRRPAIAVSAAGLVLVVGVPQLLALMVGASGARITGWGGLRWMAPGEAEASTWLRQTPRGSVLVEGIGDAYSDAARMSSTSGVPAVLGWENHQLVWRGDSIRPELDRRKRLVEQLYSSGDAAKIRSVAAEFGARFVVVGSIERSRYPKVGLEAVLGVGEHAFSAGECTIVRVGP